MEFSNEAMLFKIISVPYFLMPLPQPFQNGGRLNLWRKLKLAPVKRGTMKCCMQIDLQRMNNFSLHSSREN
jgi:hypothetical protein